MGDLLDFEPGDLWYIQLGAYDSKYPADEWGGYSQSFDASDDVYSYAEVVQSDHEWWAVCGTKDFDHGSLSTLVFDLDVHKAPEGFDVDRVTVPENTLIVRSQNGGLHVYFKVHADRGELQESDFQMLADDLGWDIDIRGSAVSMHVVAPSEITGVNTPYEVVNNAPIRTVTDPADAAERIQLDDEPLLRFDPGGRVGSGVEIDRDVEPPKEMPTCYHRGLQLRAAAPDDHPNSHKVNVLTALCGLAAGYDLDAMQQHFVDDYPPGDDVDPETSRYQLEHIAQHVDRGEYSPPSISSLRDFGILEEDEVCSCDIPYHGQNGSHRSRAGEHIQIDSSQASFQLDWSDVRTSFESGDAGYARKLAADVLEQNHDWMYVMESELLWHYDESSGYFHPWGEEKAARILENELQGFYGRRTRNNVVDRLQNRNQTHRRSIDAAEEEHPLLCVGNGVVNLATGEMQEHSPRFKFIRGLEWDYEPAKADPEPVLSFLDEITMREADLDTLLDHLAHGLMPGHPYRAFVMMYGPGSNGKTKVGELFRAFVGEDNAAAVELQDLTGGDDFATGALPGAFINVGDDVTIGEIRDASTLKSLTGGATMRANEKHEKKFDFKNEAAMFFSANEPPRISEVTEAIGDRLYPIEMPYRFLDDGERDLEDPMHKPKDPEVVTRLVENDEAMRGLLMLAVKHAQDLVESNGQYSMPEGPAERRRMYEAASDPIHRFTYEYLEPGEGSDVLLKDDVYAVYKRMCEAQDERTTREDIFKQQVTKQNIVDVESTRNRSLAPGDDREPAWRYVKFAPEAKQFMPDRVAERYGEAKPASPEDTAFDARPLQSVAESPTGYATVTVEVVDVEIGGEDRPTKGILRDKSGAMDLITWDDVVADKLAGFEGQVIAIKDADVGEYDGQKQLEAKPNLTTFQEIQRGVGHTEGQATADGQNDLTTAVDGGEIESVKQHVAEFVRTEYASGDEFDAPEVAGALDDDPGAIKDRLDTLATESRTIEDLGSGYRRL